MEESITGDIALVKAWKADPSGNLVFRGTARNFNPDCATAGRFCIAEVEEIVPMGAIKPEDVHLPGVYVKAVVQAADVEKKIERRTIAKSPDAEEKVDASPAARMRERLAKRAAMELKDGMNVNLGIGIPTLASNVSSDINTDQTWCVGYLCRVFLTFFFLSTFCVSFWC